LGVFGKINEKKNSQLVALEAESEKTLMLSANSKTAPPSDQTIFHIWKRVEKNHQSR